MDFRYADIEQALKYFHDTFEERDRKSVNSSTFAAYQFSNEPLDNIFKDFSFKGKRVASVGSSGDQLLYSALNGAKDLTLIDANVYAEFVVDLKVSAIKNLEYMEFMKYWDEGFLVGQEVYPRLREDLGERSKFFWDTLYEEYQNYDNEDFDVKRDFAKRIFHVFSPFSGHFNKMFQNSKSYGNLKESLKDCSFTFITSDLKDFTEKLEGKYDFIFLSNIYDYFDQETITSKSKKVFFNSVNELYENNLNKAGVIQFEYNFGLYPIKENEKSNINQIDFDMIKYLPNGAFVRKINNYNLSLEAYNSAYLKSRPNKYLRREDGIAYFLCKEDEFEGRE